MTTRSSSRMVSFRRSFHLDGMGAPLPAGTFEVRTEKERLEVSWEACRVVSTRIVVRRGNRTEEWHINGSQLQEALQADQLLGRPLAQ
jgi:hypothetical protein